MEDWKQKLSRLTRDPRTFLKWVCFSCVIGVVCGLVGTAFLTRAATEYSIYVDKDDVELAEYLINGGRL